VRKMKIERKKLAKGKDLYRNTMIEKSLEMESHLVEVYKKRVVETFI